MNARQLVAWRLRIPRDMRAIFGDDHNDAQGNTELFKAENGYLLVSASPKNDFPSASSSWCQTYRKTRPFSQFKKWEQHSPKEYKIIMVLDPEHKLMRMELSAYTSETWADKHGQKLQFRGDFRPGTSIFTYCEALLKRSFVHQSLHYDIAEKEG